SSLLGGNLVPGSSGSDVIALQQRLVSFGIPIFVDGVYGFETEQAVSTYQRVQGLSVTGSADNATLKSMGFSVPDYRYVAAVIADQAVLTDVQRYFPQAFVDRNRRGRFINIGSFAERFPAEARVDAAAARGFTTRVLYR
ncbi:MAG: peptidoglycan-binding domain-containing protein, partial [Cyanobacteria bacterium J06635_11]